MLEEICPKHCVFHTIVQIFTKTAQIYVKQTPISTLNLKNMKILIDNLFGVPLF